MNFSKILNWIFEIMAFIGVILIIPGIIYLKIMERGDEH
jgi:hypothetical protein